MVYKGWVPGVYDEWVDCQKQVHKLSVNCYKGYATREEAVASGGTTGGRRIG
jgi:viroplasmin and RNaseH domain-containing protein